jgi:hypothetical protein
MTDFHTHFLHCDLIYNGDVAPQNYNNQFDSVGTSRCYCLPFNTAAYLENVEVVPIFPQFYSIWLSFIHSPDAVLVISYVIS